MVKAEDRRITRSKALIRKGLFSLLEKKKLTEITIIELTGKAGINRKTFYNHYGSIYDVINEIEEECLERYKKIFTKEVLGEDDGSGELFDLLIAEIKDNEGFYRMMTHSDMHLHFIGKLTEGIKEWLLSLIPNTEDYNMELLTYYYDFISSGAVDVIHKWLLSDNPASSEEMANFFKTIVSTGEARKAFAKK